jgi:hypothetical protein
VAGQSLRWVLAIVFVTELMVSVELISEEARLSGVAEMSRSSLSFHDERIDLGVIFVVNMPIHTNLTIVNNSLSPIIVKEVKTGCSCMIVDFSTKLLPPEGREMNLAKLFHYKLNR